MFQFQIHRRDVLSVINLAQTIALVPPRLVPVQCNRESGGDCCYQGQNVFEEAYGIVLTPSFPKISYLDFSQMH